MRKLSIAALALVGMTCLASPVAFANDAHVHKSDADITLMEPSTWFQNAPAGGYTMKFNPAHPAGWAVFINPRTHTASHMAFTNPATYAQFMTPEFYMQFMNPKNWLAWLNPKSYETFLDVNTYAYWMTPHAYIHALNPDNYTQAFSLANYEPYVALETYAKWFELNSYSIMKEPEGIVEGGAGEDYISQVLNLFGLTSSNKETPLAQN